MQPLPKSWVPSGLACAALAGLAATAAETEIAFAPAEGLVLAKHVTWNAELVLTESAFEMNGESMEVEAPEITQAQGGDLAFTDRYAKVSDARLERLERTFDALEQHRSISGTPEGEGDKDETLESPLKGATVVFAWNAEDEEYDASYAEGSTEGYDVELLDDLDWDLDFAALLPDGPVAEGAEWTVDAEAMRPVMSLGGELHFDDEEDSPQEELIDEAMEDNLEGDATVTFTGMRDHEGTQVAVLHVVWEAEGTAEGEDTRELGEGRDVEIEMKTVARVGVTLEGDLLWDAAAGHFVVLDVDGTLSLTLDETQTIETPDGAFEQRSEVTFEGPVTVEVTATAP